MFDVAVDILADPDDPRLALTFATLEVNGAGVQVLLDTGAARTSLVRRPEFVVRDCVAGQGTGVFGVIEPSSCASVNLRFADRDLGEMEVLVTPVGAAHGDLIGLDVLSRFRCEYRFAERLLRLDGEPVEDGTPAHVNMTGHIYLDATWPDADLQRGAVFDTGSSITVVDVALFRDHPELFVPAGTGEGTDSTGVVLQTPMAVMKGPVLLDVEMSDSPVAIVDLGAANSALERRMDLILGWPIINQAVWMFDHAEHFAACSRIVDAL